MLSSRDGVVPRYRRLPNSKSATDGRLLSTLGLRPSTYSLQSVFDRGDTPPDCGLLYHFTSSVEPSEGPGDGRLLDEREGIDGTVSAEIEFRWSELIDPRGEMGFPILDSRC